MISLGEFSPRGLISPGCSETSACPDNISEFVSAFPTTDLDYGAILLAGLSIFMIIIMIITRDNP